MTTRIEHGSIVLTPTDARMLYQVARIGELRSRHRVGNTALYTLLTDISACAFTASVADSGIPPRQETASEERELWTVQQLARAAGLSTRTIRLDCQRGNLAAEKQGNTWLINNSAAHPYITARRRT